MKKLEGVLESLVFQCRWCLAPFFMGLLLAIAVLLVKFVKLLIGLVLLLFSGGSDHDIVIGMLSLIDAALLATLLLIMAFSGYENFVSRIGKGEHEDRPAWMGKVGFSDLKIKLMGAIVAISAIELLKAFINSGELSDRHLAWKTGIHLTFVVSGLLFAVTDRIADGKSGQ